MKSRTKSRALALGGLVLLLLATSTASARTLEVEFDAVSFAPGAAIDNQYWPLLAGTTQVYYAESADGCSVNELIVTGNTRTDFEGAYSTIVAWEVLDREWLDEECTGEYALLEETRDWYAQDVSGNVWYFGEATTAWDEDECPSTAGSWEAGTDGAEAGIVMLAQPRAGLAYRQEFLEGEAEDWAKVLRTNARVSIQVGEFAGCLKTKEWSPLERGSIEHKFYCPAGGGLMLIEELKGKTVRVEFVGTSRPPGTYAATGSCDE
jgi:hypothetical protein